MTLLSLVNIFSRFHKDKIFIYFFLIHATISINTAKYASCLIFYFMSVTVCFRKRGKYFFKKVLKCLKYKENYFKINYYLRKSQSK